MNPTPLQERVLAWHRANPRPLPWRATRDPYAVLVAEVMLQQTGVGRVLPKYEEWMRRWPTWEALASAPLGEALRMWGPLGYNRRALWLHHIARRVVREWGGHLPPDPAALASLPGVGPSTLTAVLCFAFGHDVPVVDTNIRRVLRRAVLGGDEDGRDVTALARALVPPGKGREWNLALMDLGAVVCRARRPRCGECPLASLCAWRAAGMPPAPPRKPSPPFRGSSRYYRGRLLEGLRRLPPGTSLPLSTLCAQMDIPPERGHAAARAMAAEGLVRLREEEGGETYVALPW
jgi:A/G-specific adenine glycosylase